MSKQLFAILFLTICSIVSVCSFAQAFELTGRWKCDDGGIYYIRQIGADIYWYGEKAPTNPDWTNIAQGVITGDTIVLKWADVPKGSILSSGELRLKVISNFNLQAEYKTGGFGGSNWTKGKVKKAKQPLKIGE